MLKVLKWKLSEPHSPPASTTGVVSDGVGSRVEDETEGDSNRNESRRLDLLPSHCPVESTSPRCMFTAASHDSKSISSAGVGWAEDREVDELSPETQLVATQEGNLDTCGVCVAVRNEPSEWFEEASERSTEGR